MTSQKMLIVIVSTLSPSTLPQPLDRFFPFYFRNEERAKQVMDLLKKDFKLWWDYLLIPYQGGLANYFPVLEEEADYNSPNYSLEKAFSNFYDYPDRVADKLQRAGVTIHNANGWDDFEEEMVTKHRQRLYAEKGIL